MAAKPRRPDLDDSVSAPASERRSRRNRARHAGLRAQAVKNFFVGLGGLTWSVRARVPELDDE